MSTTYQMIGKSDRYGVVNITSVFACICLSLYLSLSLSLSLSLFFSLLLLLSISLSHTHTLSPIPLPLSPFLSYSPDNRVCYGETPIEQSEFCHYDSEGECGPLAIQILEHRNITPSYGHGNAIGTGEENLCVCQFRTGRFVCDFG